MDLNVAFPFQDNFSVGTIHGTNAKSGNNPTITNTSEIVEIQDNNDNTKTSSRFESEVVVGSRIASGFKPVSGPTANLTQPGADGTPIASRGSRNPASTRLAGRVAGRQIGK